MTGSASSQDLLPADLAMGTVMLKVGDMKVMTDYYQRALGLEVVAEQDGGLYLGRLGRPLVHLAPAPGLHLPGRGEAGLLHTALLFEDQASLAATVATAAQYEPRAFSGSSDHLVSEAFYFTDPEGNGIELYTDRPRSQWSFVDGEIQMATKYLDPNDYLRRHLTQEILDAAPGLAGRVGHVHLQVGDVQVARAFYVDALGFESTATGYPGALFASAGGYHHHIAMNVWHSAGAGPRAASLGLGDVAVSVPAREDLDALISRLQSLKVAFTDDGRAIRVNDPWGTQVTVGVAGTTTDELLT